jgi:predicted TIM-barrel fold metal-dependent hydrolase
MTIIDAHHHIWRLGSLPWLQGPEVPRIFGPHAPLRRDYLAADYLADIAVSGVTASVFVQANAAAGKSLEEAQWVARTAGGHPVGAIVAGADLASPSIADELDALLAVPGVRGIRQQLHWHEKPAYRYAATPDAMLQAHWLRGFAELDARGLVFELQVFPSQYDAALSLVDRFPSTPFVLLHAGMPEDRSAAGDASWRQGLRRFAERPNVVTKLSGLGTFSRSCDERLWAPVVRATVDIFGPARCMFGSNFPIESLWTTYRDLVAVFQACIAPYDAGERASILSGTAARVYGVAAGSPAPSQPSHT